MSERRIDGWTDGRTDEWMDRARREAKGRKVERVSPRGVKLMKGMHDYMGGFKRILLALNSNKNELDLAQALKHEKPR